ncbi:hypothetical protein FHU10_1336 [Serratia fonticola]|uniref:Uncharacterized protein n=1 Tax=Serratia fonticola TaxID=47917 RepID=A0A542BJ69_SERFO|nr:hypothetical protein [Serratia fonticola]TQI78626.1 hypothetical protein FHU09_1114 [Serratia fonticola]TQI99352.1 hypothetical protein FHU11_4938 [Serratia fonticola]TVZ68877.1 hypothetical protein FHU10_1336 [Serratia fonticola]
MSKRNIGIILGVLLASSSSVVVRAAIDEQHVTLYSPYHAGTVRDDAFELRQTGLVLIQPELKTFADEDSEEAQDYATAMDDWSYYASETTQHFEALPVQVVNTDKRYLIFTLGKDQRMIFDTRKPQPGAEEGVWGAFLYRQGQPPMGVDITDNDMAAAKTYLGLK